MWYVSSRSGVATLRTAIHLLPTYLLTYYTLDGLFSRTIWVSRYQKDKTSLDFNDARDDGVWVWQWHQLDHMQTICASLQTDSPQDGVLAELLLA